MTNASVSVVVPTRNRASDVRECVKSILANPEADIEVVVVDQSDDEASKDLLRHSLEDPRLRHVRSTTRGASRSRNVGIASTSAPIVAFTDDDCRVPQDWIGRLKEVFAANPDAAIVFGRVTVPPDVDGKLLYAAVFEPGQREYKDTYPPAGKPWGIGANMAFRRSVFETVGMFDPLLGPGAKFPAAEEYDLAIRVLASRMKILNAAEVSVLHLGVREGGAASSLVRGYGVAIGAALAKHVRLGTRGSGKLLTNWVAFHGASAVRNALLGRRPTNLGFVASLLAGILRSWSQPIDARHLVYKDS